MASEFLDAARLVLRPDEYTTSPISSSQQGIRHDSHRADPRGVLHHHEALICHSIPHKEKAIVRPANDLIAAWNFSHDESL
jgi:hypothetical protein